MSLLLGVVTGSPESPLATRGAKQAVPALTVEDVPTIRARKACRNLGASELGVQSRMVTVQPKGEALSRPERRGLIHPSALLATEGRLIGVEREPAPAALAWSEEATLDALDAAELPGDAWNDHQATQVAGETADAARTLPSGNERMDDIQSQNYRFKMSLHDSIPPSIRAAWHCFAWG